MNRTQIIGLSATAIVVVAIGSTWWLPDPTESSKGGQSFHHSTEASRVEKGSRSRVQPKISDPKTGRLVNDPNFEAFKWNAPLLFPMKITKAVEASVNAPEEVISSSFDALVSSSRRPIQTKEEALIRVREIPLPLMQVNPPKRGYEMREYFVISNRGRYDLGDFSSGIAIRKGDGEIFLWGLPD
jgi:hypothetical protein